MEPAASSFPEVTWSSGEHLHSSRGTERAGHEPALCVRAPASGLLCAGAGRRGRCADPEDCAGGLCSFWAVPGSCFVFLVLTCQRRKKGVSTPTAIPRCHPFIRPPLPLCLVCWPRCAFTKQMSWANCAAVSASLKWERWTSIQVSFVPRRSGMGE